MGTWTPGRVAVAVALGVASIGAILAVIGSFMTWATIDPPLLDTIEIGGFDEGREGQWTVALGIAAIVASVAWVRPQFMLAGAIATTVLGAAVAYLAIADIRELDDESKVLDQIGIFSLRLSDIVDTELGTGIVLVALGGVVMLAGGAVATVAALVDRRRTA